MPSHFIWVVLALVFSLTGCATFKREPVKYETVSANHRSDTKEAIKHHNAALELLEKEDLDRAEQRLNKALIADVSFGPAHNTLGHVYFRRGQFYLAAWEFEYAVRLMPDHATPQNNLGLVYEEAGRLTEAADKYRAALALSPGDVEFSGNLTRVRIRLGERTSETATQLSELALRDDRREWRDWAQLQLNSTHLDLLPSDATSPPIDWPKPVPVGTSHWEEPVPVELPQPTTPQLAPPVEVEAPQIAPAQTQHAPSKPEGYARTVTTIIRSPEAKPRSNWKSTTATAER